VLIFAFSFDPQNFLNSWQSQYGQMPGAFLVVSLLPVVGRVRYRWP